MRTFFFLLTFASLAFLSTRSAADLAVFELQFKYERMGITVTCHEGCAWTESSSIATTIGSRHYLDFYGDSRQPMERTEQPAFSFRIDKTAHNKVEITSLNDGAAFETLSFHLNPGETRFVNQYGGGAKE